MYRPVVVQYVYDIDGVECGRSSSLQYKPRNGFLIDRSLRAHGQKFRKNHNIALVQPADAVHFDD